MAVAVVVRAQGVLTAGRGSRLGSVETVSPTAFQPSRLAIGGPYGPTVVQRQVDVEVAGHIQVDPFEEPQHVFAGLSPPGFIDHVIGGDAGSAAYGEADRIEAEPVLASRYASPVTAKARSGSTNTAPPMRLATAARTSHLLQDMLVPIGVAGISSPSNL